MMGGEPRPPGSDGHGAESSVAAAAPAQPEARTTPPASPDLIEPTELQHVVQVIGSVVAQTTLLSALLYYFGYMYTDARAQVLGIDATTLGYSTHDYILRSIVPVAPIFGFLLLVGLISMRVHARLKTWVDSGRHLLLLQRLAGTMIVVGTTLLVVGVFAIWGGFDWLFGSSAEKWVDKHLILAPLSVLLGVVGAAYGTQIRRGWLSLGPLGASREVQARAPRWLRLIRLALIFVLIGVNVFWAAGEFAISMGTADAKFLVEDLPYWPQAVVHSKEPLGIDPGGGITVDQGAGAEDGYRFRYGGLRYLTRSAGKYFLLSPCWSKHTGRTIVLTDDDSVRIEVTRSGTPPACG